MKPFSNMITYAASVARYKNFLFHIKSLFPKLKVARIEDVHDDIYIHTTPCFLFRIHNTSCFESRKIHVSEIRSFAEYFDIKQRNFVFLLRFLWERRFLNRGKVITGKDVILKFENGDVVKFDLSHFSDCLSEELTHEDINRIISKLIKKSVITDEYGPLSNREITLINEI